MFNKALSAISDRVTPAVVKLRQQYKDFKLYNLGAVAIHHLTPKKGYQVKCNMAYGLKARQRFDLYTSHQPKHKLIVFVHGGAWTHGDKSGYRFLGEAFARYGYDVAVLNYHLAPEHKFPVYVNDLGLCLDYILNHQQKLGIQAQQIILMGHSAGAFNIASLLYHPIVTDAAWYERVKAMVGISGPYYFDYKGDPLAESAFDINVHYEQVMPTQFVRENHIQHLLLVAEQDRVVKDSNTEKFAAALHAVGNECQVVRIAKTGHVSIMGSVSSLFAPLFKTRATIIKFLDQLD